MLIKKIPIQMICGSLAKTPDFCLENRPGREGIGDKDNCC